jgi:hypothetical protein
MNRKTPLRLLSLFGGAAIIVACANGNSDVPPVADGSVTFDWTLLGVKDSRQCDIQVVQTFDVVVTNPDGSPYAEFRESCDVFSTTVLLPVGRYAANAVLLDPQNFERTSEIPVNPFDVVSATDLLIPLDFPATSFK